jgi:probable selenate reductase FAD-binding subunit
MITQYHRPDTLENALALLANPNTLALGGGTKINTPAYKGKDFAVVDLQKLGLGHLKKSGYTLEIGATTTLEELLQNDHTPLGLQQAIRLESTLNLRNIATVAGTLVSAEGRSPFGVMMLALDAKLTFIGQQTTVINLSEYLALRPAGLITQINLPLNIKTAYEQVARTPADLPIVAAALVQWANGRTRLALGGYGKSALLAMDGTEADGLEAAAKNTFHEAADAWASAEYRMDVAATLARRCLESAQ